MKNISLLALQTVVAGLFIGVIVAYFASIIHSLSGINLAPHVPAPDMMSSVVGVICGFITSLLVMRWNVSPFWSGVRIAAIFCVIRLVETVISFTVGGRILAEEWNLPVVSFSIDIFRGLALGYAIRYTHRHFETSEQSSVTIA